jgi:hypothetical protein
MITARTLSIALLLWKAFKITEVVSAEAQECISFTRATVASMGYSDWTELTRQIADHPPCKNAVMDSVKVVGVSAGTIASGQRRELMFIVAAFLAFKVNEDKSLAFNELPDLVLALLSVFGLPLNINARKRGSDGRFIRTEL